jgi:hypothetical protein
VLVTFGLVVRSRSQTFSVDSVARDIQALVVVNGGDLLFPLTGKRVRHVHLFVNSDRVVALSKPANPLLEIPFSRIRDLSAHAVSARTGHEGSVWNLDVTWQSAELTTTRFYYEGTFAEHLARVAEATLRGLWKKELPVLKA